jgi:hypothetical protein
VAERVGAIGAGDGIAGAVDHLGRERDVRRGAGHTGDRLDAGDVPMSASVPVETRSRSTTPVRIVSASSPSPWRSGAG